MKTLKCILSVVALFFLGVGSLEASQASAFLPHFSIGALPTQRFSSLALISTIYSFPTYLLCALVLMWISIYLRRLKQYKENVWLYAAKVVPLWVGLVAVAFLPLLLISFFILKAFLGARVVVVSGHIALFSLSLCVVTLCLVFSLAIRRKQFAHSYKIFTLYFLLSASFIFSLTMIASYYEVKEYEERMEKFWNSKAKENAETKAKIRIMNYLLEIEKLAAQGDQDALKKLDEIKRKDDKLQAILDSEEMQAYRVELNKKEDL